jgi:hypothetical protein
MQLLMPRMSLVGIVVGFLGLMCWSCLCVVIHTQGNHLLIDISHKVRNTAVASPIILDATPTSTSTSGYRGLTAAGAFNATTATSISANVPIIRLGW